MRLPTERWAGYAHRQMDDYRPAKKRRTWRENEEAAKERAERIKSGLPIDQQPAQ